MSEITDLKAQIEKLAQEQQKANSFWAVFLRGVAYGFGFFIGGTVIVAILISLLSRLSASSELGHLGTRLLQLITTGN